MEIVKAAQGEGVKILGLDGFYISEKATQPSLENSIDFTQVANSTLDPLVFLRRHELVDLYFEVILLGSF